MKRTLNSADAVKQVVRKNISTPKPEDFVSRQLDLFRGFLCNTEAERASLSNVFDLWDSIPRYVISRQLQDKWRKSGSFPLLYKIPFHYRGRELTATFQPASIEDKNGVVRSYFPSSSEEIIEDVLRKIAAEQNYGYHISEEKRTGVTFTLHMLRKELKNRGHERTYNDIILSLDIMARSVIITSTSDNKEGEFISSSLYLNNLTRVSKQKLAEDPKAKWTADFHPFASRALDDLTYRQFNYLRLMSHSNQLTRWLNKVLCLKYLQASLLTTFEIRFSTIKRDSGLLSGYKRNRSAIEAVDSAFIELHECAPPLLGKKPDRKVIDGARGIILDVVYVLTPSIEFISEVKAANKRKSLAEEKQRRGIIGGGSGKLPGIIGGGSQGL